MNLAKFFPGLSGSTPPTVTSAIGASSSFPPPLLAALAYQHDAASANRVDCSASSPGDLLGIADIAKYPVTKPTRLSGNAVWCEADYVCYGVKKGSVRLIEKSTAVRTLLQGHSQPLVDVNFAPKSGPNEYSLLATAAEDGLVIVWEATFRAEHGVAKEPMLEASESMRLRVPQGQQLSRVVFHPKLKKFLFVVHENVVSVVFMNKALWEAFSQLPTPELGLPIEKHAAMRMAHCHTGRITDLSFSSDGSKALTTGEDGTIAVWGIPLGQTVGDLVPESKVNLTYPLSFGSFVGKSESMIACGAPAQSGLMLISATAQHEILHTLTLVSPGQGAIHRAQTLQNIKVGSVLVLTDSSAPVLTLVQVDEEGKCFRRAVCLKTPRPVFAFRAYTEEDLLKMSTMDDTMIQLCEVNLSSVFAFPASTQVRRSIPSVVVSAPVPVSPPPPPPPVQAPAQAPVQPTTQATVQALVAAPPVTVTHPISAPKQPIAPMPRQESFNASSLLNSVLEPLPPRASPSPPPLLTVPNGPVESTLDLAQIDRIVQAKMDILIAKLEQSAKAREDAERERQKRLLEMLSSTLTTVVPALVEKAVDAKLSSPEFLGSLSATIRNATEQTLKLNLDKALKMAMEKQSENVVAAVTLKLQPTISKAFEDAFRTRMVPAFEVGCREMMGQFHQALAAGQAGIAQPQQQQQQQQQDVQQPAPREMTVSNRIREALNSRNVAEALKLAVQSENPMLLTETCRAVDLKNLLSSSMHGVPQALLLALLQTLTRDVRNDPTHKLDWIEAVALEIDPRSGDIGPHVSGVAREARDELDRDQDYLTSFGANPRSAIRILDKMVR